MIVVDTTELARHTQRKLHAAWWELQGKQLLATPAVAEELAGKLVNAAGRLINELRAHPDPIRLVEQTRKLLPSATIDSERNHPTYLR